MSASVLEEGALVDAYRIEAHLGSGGFGAVYRVRAPDGGAYALKLSHATANRLTAQQMIMHQNEIEALQKVAHPSLVKVFGYGILDDRQLYLVMELVEGESLDAYLQRRLQLDPLEAIQIARKVAEALHHCHERNLLHRDLKPQNIMITDPHEPRIKVLDFGLAQLADSFRPVEGEPWSGSPPYMAPEAFTRDAAVTSHSKCDLYALGVVLFEMLAGSVPFVAANLAQMILQKLHADALPLQHLRPSVPAGLSALVQSLLTRDPARRPGSAAALAARLRELYLETLREGEISADGSAPSVGGAAERIVSELGPPEEGAPSDRAPFAGREPELAILRGHLQAVLGGATRMATLVGEPGIGKSRLVAELLRRELAGNQAFVAYGRCRQLEGMVPYSSLREALAQLATTVRIRGRGKAEATFDRLAAMDEADTSMFLSLVPEMANLLPRGDHAGQNVSAALRLVGPDRVARAITSLMFALTATRPVVLVLEDLHWADAATLAVIEHLTGPDAAPGTMVLGTSRPGVALRGEKAEQIPLRALDEAESGDLLNLLMLGSQRDLFASLTHAVPLLASGNPLVITRIIRNLEAEGFLARSAGGALGATGRNLEGYSPPASLAEVVQRTLTLLDPSAREVLAVAAMLGRQFHPSDLATSELFPDEVVARALADGERNNLCRRQGDRCTFAHDTVREHLEGTVAAERRPAIHRRLAARLRLRGVPPGTLAHHLEQAGETALAAEAFVEAGIAADRLHDPAGASSSFQRAFELLASLPGDARRDELLARVSYELSRVAAALGNTAVVQAQLDRCAVLLESAPPARRLPLDSALARLHYVQGNVQKAAEHAIRCLATPSDDPLARLYRCVPSNLLGRAACVTGKFSRAAAMLTTGCELSRDTGEYTELSHSAGLLSVALGFTGRLAEAEERSQSCTQLALQLEDPFRILGAHLYRSALSEARFDWETGVASAASLISFAEEHAIGGLYLYVGTVYAGRHQFHLGRIDRAQVLIANAVNLANSLKISMLLAWASAYLGDALFVAGRDAEARERYEQALALADAGTGDDYAGALARIGLCHLASRNGGSAAELRALADEALVRLERAGNVSARIVALQRYAESMAAVGEAEDAARLRALGDEARAGFGPEFSADRCDFWPRSAREREPSRHGDHGYAATVALSQDVDSGAKTTFAEVATMEGAKLSS